LGFIVLICSANDNNNNGGGGGGAGGSSGRGRGTEQTPMTDTNGGGFICTCAHANISAKHGLYADSECGTGW